MKRIEENPLLLIFKANGPEVKLHTIIRFDSIDDLFHYTRTNAQMERYPGWGIDTREPKWRNYKHAK